MHRERGGYLSLISTRVSSLSSAGIRVIFEEAQKIPDAIHLEIGQPDFVTPKTICDAAIVAMAAGQTGYTPNAGTLRLRQLLASDLCARGIPASPTDVVVTTGGMGGLATSITALLNPGDEVLVPDPGWPNYSMQITCAGGTPVPYRLRIEHGYCPRVEDVEAMITPLTRAIVVNSPSNPTGAVFDSGTVEAIQDLARRRALWIISDEVYQDLIFDGTHHTFLTEAARAFTVGVFSFSKSFAMTGWRVGYVVAPDLLVQQITKLQEVYTACASSISQAAACRAVEVGQECVEPMRREYRRRRDLIVDAMNRMGIRFFFPSGTFYCLVDISSSGIDSMQFAMRLLHETGVAVAPGTTFGQQSASMIRICFAAPEHTLLEGIRRIGSFLRALGANREVAAPTG